MDNEETSDVEEEEVYRSKDRGKKSSKSKKQSSKESFAKKDGSKSKCPTTTITYVCLFSNWTDFAVHTVLGKSLLSCTHVNFTFLMQSEIRRNTLNALHQFDRRMPCSPYYCITVNFIV